MTKVQVKQRKSIYSYLRECGVLENGTHEEIQEARKKFWREYKRDWRKEKRKSEKEFTISLSQEEQKQLSKEARRHNVSRTKFIKQACFAYMNKCYIVPEAVEVRRIAQVLAMTYNLIQKQVFEGRIDTLNGQEVLAKILQLESDLVPILNHPNTIEVYIKDWLAKAPQSKSIILELLRTIEA